MSRIAIIPEEYIRGFLNIERASVNDIKYLTNLINELQDYSFPHVWTDKISNKITSFTKDEVSEIIMSIGGLIGFKDDPQEPVTNEEIIDDISEIISKRQEIDKDVFKTNEFKFKEKLKILLENEIIFYSFKSSNLLSINENSYHSARIVSDLRPIFGLNIKETPKVVTIVHNLNLHYIRGEHREHDDFFIALDSNDLQNMKAIIERAEIKEKSLEELLKDTTIKIFKTQQNK